MIPLLFVILTTVVPLVSSLVFTIMIWSIFNNSIDEVRIVKGDHGTLKKSKFKFVVMLTIMLYLPLVFGVVVLVLLLVNDDGLTDVQNRVVYSGTWVMGSTLVVASLAQGLITSLSMKDYMKEKEPTPEQMNEHYRNSGAGVSFGIRKGSSLPPSPYVRSVTLFSIPMTIGIYGMLVMLMMMSVSGIFGGEPDEASEAGEEWENYRGIGIHINNIDEVERGCMAMSVLTCFSLASGILPIFKKGSIMDKKVFKWKVILSAGGTLPVIAGYLIHIISMI